MTGQINNLDGVGVENGVCERREGGDKFAFYIDKRTERQLFYIKKLMMEKCEPAHPDFFMFI